MYFNFLLLSDLVQIEIICPCLEDSDIKAKLCICLLLNIRLM